MRVHHAGFAAFRKGMQLSNLATDPSYLAKRSISHTFIAEKNKFVSRESLNHTCFNPWNCVGVSKLNENSNLSTGRLEYLIETFRALGVARLTLQINKIR